LSSAVVLIPADRQSGREVSVVRTQD
jgi:hypothetical protein